jgi:DNA-binding CsgD family transcriptional regulator/tetratricopeptide (TPR) repeat protein
VAYPLLRTVAALPECDVRNSLRHAVDHGVLVPDQATGAFRFRHALLAEAIYSTILPGEREELHARLAEELARNGAAAAELAPHWAVAGRAPEAIAASVEAARQAQAVFGLAEAHAHLERVIGLWESVPDPVALVGLDLPDVCSWAAELASQAGAAPRAVELMQRAISLVDDQPVRAAPLVECRGCYLHESGQTGASLDEYQRAVDLLSAQPPSAERAGALASLGAGLGRMWRFEESLAACQQALAMMNDVGDFHAEPRARRALGIGLVYLGRTGEGLDQLRRAVRRSVEADDPRSAVRSYVALTDALTMLGQPRASIEAAEEGLRGVARYGIDTTALTSNYIEALVATGDWDLADRVSAGALGSLTANFPSMLLINRAEMETGRGRFDEARSHLRAAQDTLREDRGFGVYDVYIAELALWERRWTDADQAARDGLALAAAKHAAQIRVRLCAKGLRALAELALLAHARRDHAAASRWLDRAAELLASARCAASAAAAITPNSCGWLALCETEHERACGRATPDQWSDAAVTWERLERHPSAAYARWRQAEALVAVGASTRDASVPLRAAHATAQRIGAQPLLAELDLLAQRARLDLAEPETGLVHAPSTMADVLGLTGREAEVLSLVAQGYTNREIAETFVISEKTASVHVSNILRKLHAPNRREAAAIAHRLTPPPLH